MSTSVKDEKYYSPESNQAIIVNAFIDRLDNLASESHSFNDPAIDPLIQQTRNHLEHVTYSFRVAGDSEDFPYHLRRERAYPDVPTWLAIESAGRLFNLFDGSSNPETPETDEFTQEYGEIALKKQNEIVQDLLADPLKVLDDYTDRRDKGGDETSFPELGWTLKSLASDIVNKSEVNQACEASPLLAKLRNSILTDVKSKIEEDKFGYRSTLFMIEDAIAFVDIAIRAIDPDAPPTYHSARFEYNWHSLTEEPGLTLLPTMASVTSEDLLKVRGVPIAIIGVSTSTLRVDGFPQTPYEFFHHDVDHTRRMYEETLAAIEREGVTPRKYYEDATRLTFDQLLPSITIEEGMGDDERDLRIAKRMILFEVEHEDAGDPTKDTIAESILRAPMERTPFERLVDNNIVEYFMAPRASTLAHVFRKLAHTFYDLPEKRSTSLGTDFARTRLSIAQAAAELYRLVSDDPIDDESLLTTCRDLVSTDEGFTDAFMGNIAHDIARRGVGRSALRLMIARPLGVGAAVRKVKQHRPMVHSLFGYSGLEYEDPELLERTVISDLADFDPNETTIAIGATPYGIGRLYPAVKRMGFFTLGIVASTALGLNEEASEGVDEIVVVKDNGWGGYRYNGSSNGLLSPTTRVFVGASDSIAAYGGGEITAVTLEEARRRGKPVSYRPFDMDHRIADMMNGQSGNERPTDYRGPAYAKWQTLNAIDGSL